MKRVLFIAYFFPPLANSGTQRPLKFANHLPEFGWEPMILTVDKAPDRDVEPGLLRELRPGLRITRVPMASELIGGALDSLTSSLFANPSLGSSVSWRLRKYFHTPDIYALWRPTAVRAGCALYHEVGFDAIWATGYPWTSLLIGRDISRLTGRPLIADFRDPWTGEDLFEVPTNGALSKHKRLERSVLSRAAGIVAVAQMVTDELRTLTPNASRKQFATIANGFDRADLQKVSASTVPRRARFRVVYTGVWKEGYGLEVLYDALRSFRSRSSTAASDLEVLAAGFEPGYAARYGVTDMVTELGRVPHSTALGLIHSADALFLPVATGKRLRVHLPGKLYEYAASGRPILAVAETPSEVSMFLNEVGGGIVIPPNDSEALARALAALCSNALQVPPVQPTRLDRYERGALTEKLADLLNRVSHAAT